MEIKKLIKKFKKELEWIKDEVNMQPTDRGIKHLKSQIVSYIIPLSEARVSQFSRETKV